MSESEKTQEKEMEVQELNDEALEDVAGGVGDTNNGCTVTNNCKVL